MENSQYSDTKKLKQAEKLALLNDDPSLAIFDELQGIGDVLHAIADKEIPTPEPFPEIPKVDLGPTNDLLKKLLDLKNEPIDVSVKLNLV